MAHAVSRRTWTLCSILLMALAPASGAADESGQTFQSHSIEELQSGGARPDSFNRFVDGSRARQGDAGLPDVIAPREAVGPRARIRLNQPQPDRRPSVAAVPPARRPASLQSPWRLDPGFDDLPARKLGAVLGLGFFLIAASMLETRPDAPQEPESCQETPNPPAAAPPIPAPKPPTAPACAASPQIHSPFIDTRMPVPTWRAISRREQELIERWSSSRERSLGLASLTDWIEAHAGAEGVDVSLLKAKLRRDA
ncbi:MAG: hypothetical protein ACHQ2Z_06145 [Elusimicrobiota bacterium]